MLNRGCCRILGDRIAAASVQKKGNLTWIKIERVTRAFKGEEVDHIPVCLWKHIPPTLWKDELFIKAQMDFYKETDVDFIKLSADKYFCWPAPVLKDIQSAKQLYDIKPLGAHSSTHQRSDQPYKEDHGRDQW